jgi:hypothetical protein
VAFGERIRVVVVVVVVLVGGAVALARRGEETSGVSTMRSNAGDGGDFLSDSPFLLEPSGVRFRRSMGLVKPDSCDAASRLAWELVPVCF